MQTALLVGAEVNSDGTFGVDNLDILGRIEKKQSGLWFHGTGDFHPWSCRLEDNSIGSHGIGEGGGENFEFSIRGLRGHTTFIFKRKIPEEEREVYRYFRLINVASSEYQAIRSK